MPISNRLNTKISSTMLCLIGFELFSRWVLLLIRLLLVTQIKIDFKKLRNVYSIPKGLKRSKEIRRMRIWY